MAFVAEAFVAEFVRKDGTKDRHTFRNCME